MFCNRAQDFHMPPVIGDIEQLNCCKLLGVIFQHNLKIDSHVQYIMSQCAQRMYVSAKVTTSTGYASWSLVNCCALYNCLTYFICCTSLGRIFVS